MESTRWIVTGIGLAISALAAIGCQTEERLGPQGNAGAVFIGREQCDKAIRDYTKAIELNPDDADAYFGRGFVRSVMGQHREAIRDYSRTIELKPDYAVAYENRGTEHYREGQYDLAVQDYTRAIELKPDYPIAYGNRAWGLGRLKDYDKAWADVRMCRKQGGEPDPSLVAFLAKASGRSE